MNRRVFLKTLLLTAAANSLPCAAIAGSSQSCLHPQSIRKNSRPKPEAPLQKTGHGDIFTNAEDYIILRSTVKRLARMQQSVGHGNFALLNFDEAVIHASYDPFIGRFTSSEIDFLEKTFYQDARQYGFMGEKPLTKFTADVKKQDFIRIPCNGNYLFTGISLETYQRMTRDVGRKLILTSGIRGVIKQSYLFLNKALKKKGNLTLASKSLAPPGYSFHGIGDFDVGRIGLGVDNFTSLFTKTDVFRKLKSLDYIQLRYTPDNRLGVRFEPWHIKVIA